MMTFFLAMALHPDMMRQAQQELDDITGRDRLPTFEDRIRLPFIEALCRARISFSYHHHPLVELGLWSLPPTFTTLNHPSLPQQSCPSLSSVLLSLNPTLFPSMGSPWTEPPSGGWLRPSLRRPPDLLSLPPSQSVAEPPSSQPDPFLRALDESILATGPAILNPPSLSEWLYTLARTMATSRDGLRNIMSKYPTTTFTDLTDQDLDYVDTLAKCSFELNRFIGEIHSDPDSIFLCQSCLTSYSVDITESDWKAVLHECGGRIHDARERLISSATSSITQEINDWDSFQRHTLKEAIITSIISHTPPSHLQDLGADPRLDDWFVRARASLMDTASIRAQADADAHRDILYADLCAKAEADATSQAKAFFDQTLARLRNEAELAAHDAVKAAASLAPPLGKSTSSSGRAGRKAKASPVVSRPPSRATVLSPTPLHLPPNSPKATTLGMGLDLASPIVSSPRPPSPSVPMVTDDTTPTGSPAVRPALVERYTSVVPDSQGSHAPSPVPGSHAAVPTTCCDTSLLDRTAPHGGGIDRSASVHPEVAMVVAPRVEGANTNPTNNHTAPSSDFDRIMQALAGISAKVDGVDLRVSTLTTRVSTLEKGGMPPCDYTNLDDGDGYMPDFDYLNMPVDLEESIARLEDEQTREQDEEDHAIDLLYDNIVLGSLYGERKANITNPHPDASLDFFARVAYAWASERKLSLAALDHAGRMDLAAHFRARLHDLGTSRTALTSAPPTACTAGTGTSTAPIVVDSSPDPTPSSSQQARDAHTFIFDCDDARPAPKSAPSAWTTVSRRRNTPSTVPKAVSFASVAAKPAPAPSTLPPSVAQASSGLSRDALLAMTAKEVRSAYTLRFGGRLGRNHTKEGVVEAYLSKARSDAGSKPTQPTPPKILQSTEFTVVRDPDSFSLKAKNCVDNLGRRRDAASIIRQLQTTIRTSLPPNVRPRAELIGGRWSSQSSSNFVLTFGGQPSNDDILSLREVFYDFFGPGSLLLPAKGYTRVLFNLVPIPSLPLPSPSDLLTELGLNPVCQGLTIVAPPRWVNADKVTSASRHGSITFAFIDPDGSRLSNIKWSPLCLFGGVVRPKLGVSKPLIAQCSRCWKLGHAVDTCSKKAGVPICFICGAGHDATMHGIQCNKAKKHNTLKCNCEITCLNCHKGGHHAKDVRCPLRKRFRDVNTCTGNSSDEESHTITAAAEVTPSPAGPSPHPSIPVRND